MSKNVERPVMRFTDPQGMPVEVWIEQAGVWIELGDHYCDGSSGATFTVDQIRQLLALLEQVQK